MMLIMMMMMMLITMQDDVDHNAGTVVNINSYVDYDILNDTIDDSNSRYK